MTSMQKFSHPANSHKLGSTERGSTFPANMAAPNVAALHRKGKRQNSCSLKLYNSLFYAGMDVHKYPNMVVLSMKSVDVGTYLKLVMD